MNKQVRKELTSITELIEKAKELLSEAKSQIEDIQASEMEKYDNMPEGLQDSEKGQKLYDNDSNFDDIINALDSCESEAESATSSIEIASE